MLDIPKTNLVSTIELPNNTNLRIGMKKDKEKEASYEEAKSEASISWKDILVKATAEVIGTAILVFVGCISCVNTLGTGVNHITICISFGVAVLIVVQIFGHISGSHVNPSITLAAVILGEMKHYGLVPVYLISQLLGATLGYGLIAVVTPGRLFWRTDDTGAQLPGFCVTIPHPSISSWQAILVEMFLTACLIWVCGGIWDHRNKNNTDSIAIKFGLTVCGLAMSGGFYTGASMNPARTFGPALISGNWKQHWVYWVGPLSGSAIAATLYRFLFSVPKPEPVYIEEIPLQSNSKSDHV